MKSFGEYANHYDIVYESKGYESDCRLVSRLLQEYVPNARSILDLGCGTGTHAQILTRMGFELSGMDSSATMLERARIKIPERAESFHEARIGALSLGKKYDAIISLFHVLSYQTAPKEIQDFFDCISRHLAPGGLAIVDYWYAPAVKEMGLMPRSKVFLSPDASIHRTVKPVHTLDPSVYDIELRIEVKKDEKPLREFEEIHRLRSFETSEIETFAKESGLRPILHLAGDGAAEPDENSWTSYTLLRMS